MKKSKAETAQTRKRIVQAATEAFRTNGIHATGVAEIMSAAGLTHGGFYRHFDSKEDLLAAACASAMESTLEAMDSSDETGEHALIEHLDAQVWDKNHRDCLGECPLIAMGSELARADDDTRHAATHGYRELIEVMAEKGASDEGTAMFAFSAILGAITVARIVDDPQLAALILCETKQRVARVWPSAPADETQAQRDDPIPVS